MKPVFVRTTKQYEYVVTLDDLRKMLKIPKDAESFSIVHCGDAIYDSLTIRFNLTNTTEGS